ncbi:MAG: type I methionyl aminopeptidase [Bradymonadales bacterium]|nr:type I methionyl aminopeptidase [Bradymonadales bacterium]
MPFPKLRIGRNDPCPCGSGLKYKKCCLGKPPDQIVDVRELYFQRYRIRLKKPEEIEGIRTAGRLAIETLDRVEALIRPGLATEEIDRFVAELTASHGGVCAPLNYEGFPKSVCVSINEVICHGIPSSRRLQEGDIVNVDVTPILNGFYADASKTFFVGQPGPQATTIVRVARRCLSLGVQQVRPGATTGDIGWAIQSYAEQQGCSVVRDFVGHGVGLDFHEPPQIPHYGRKGQGLTLVAGMVFTIEPMINLGTYELKVLDDGWTAVTMDGSLSAQFEQTVLVTPSGYEILTPFD